MKKELEITRQVVVESKQQQDLLMMQNRVLMEQVKTMNEMMKRQEMMMSGFMNRFPVGASEPGGGVVDLAKHQLAHPYPTCVEELERAVDDYGAQMQQHGLVGIVVDIMDSQEIFDVAVRGFHPRLKKWCGRNAQRHDVVSRKTTPCQYVIAEDRVVCMRGGTKDVERMNPMASPWFQAMQNDLAAADPVFGAQAAHAGDNQMTGLVMGHLMGGVSIEETLSKADELGIRAEVEGMEGLLGTSPPAPHRTGSCSLHRHPRTPKPAAGAPGVP